MVKRKSEFWDYVETENACLKCVFCGFVFSGSSSISCIKAHLSGVEALGINICGIVPENVKAAAAAAYEASQSVNKRLKTVPSSSANELRNAVPTSSQGQTNENENGDIEHINYARTCEINIEKLKNEAEKLMNARSSLQHLVEEATKNGEKIEDHVENWLTRADKAIQNANELTVQGEEIEAIGLFSNLKSRYQLSKKAETEASAIAMLQKQCDFRLISYRVPLKEIVSSAVDGYQTLDSRELKLKEVMDALHDPYVNMIGVYGMGGIGKTTLAKEIAKRSIEEKLCDVVVMATVSATPKVKEIQGKIADLLRFKFDEETESGRACRLQQRLTEELKKRNILIILDDLWEQLKLEEVGIPFGKDGKGCKILLTSRKRDILSNEMRTQREFNLGDLSEEEAWRLFERTAGEFKDPELQYIATEVAKRCAGLPIFIVTVAATLKNKPLHEWVDALKQLSKFDNQGIQAKTYSTLKFSYDHLDGGVQPFFLLCGLLGKSDISILDLLKYSMGLSLFKHISTVTDARNRVLTMIGHLKNSCLLQDGDRNGFVKMHDVVREVAVSIASDDQQVVTDRDDIGLKGWPDNDMLKRCKKISLPYCDIDDIPDGLKCPEVELFLLFTKNRLLKVPDQLFEGFKKLKALSFAGMRFPFLPPSLSSLSNLQTLCLNDCMLSDVVIVGALQNLQILSFRGSNIAELPREIEQLTRLKLLDLSNCFYLKVIPANVISKLTLLEELYMRNSFNQWEVKAFNSQSHASLAELEHLSRLSALEIHVPDAKMLPKDFFSKELERYKICIGNKWSLRNSSHKTSRSLELSSSICLENGVKVLLKGTKTLFLDRINGINNVLCDLDSNGFQHLKYLKLINCPNIQFITSSSVPSNAFPMLEFLSLSDLGSLEKVFHGQLVKGSFSALRTLKVSHCHKLKNLFTFLTVQGLSHLRELEIKDCYEMEVIVADENEDINRKNSVVKFTQLRSLTLKSLPQLKSFFFKVNGPSTSQARMREIVAGGELDASFALPLFIKMVSFPSLEDLNIGSIPCKRVWDDHQLSQISPNITRISVSDCKNLKYLLTCSSVTSLLRLQRLEICSCELMEEIILREQERTDMIVFSKLENLSLRSLANVTRFCSGCSIKCHSLRQLEIRKCNALTTFISNLTTKQVKSHHTKNQSLFDEKVEFSNLQEMTLEGCGKIKIVFPSNVSKRFRRLEKLDVSSCDSLEMIYQLTAGSNVEVFNLRQMRLCGLGNLEYIWSKDTQETHEEFQLQHDISTQEPYNWVEEVFPNLENLTLDSKATMMMVLCDFSTRFFSKLKFLHFEGLGMKFFVPVIRIIEKLHDLEGLSVRSSDWLWLYFLKYGRLPRIRILQLEHFSRLENIAHGFCTIPLYVEHVNVSWCNALINLALPSGSFKNLTTLEVKYCRRLLKLVTSSVAKSMVQLVTMRICSCHLLTEIIADRMEEEEEEKIFCKLRNLELYEEEEEEIIFCKLRNLELSELRRLTCFFSGSCNLKFPSLEEVTVRECPNLRIFCHGDVSTPKLVNVQSDAGNWNWEGNLNCTIQHL